MFQQDSCGKNPCVRVLIHYQTTKFRPIPITTFTTTYTLFSLGYKVLYNTRKGTKPNAGLLSDLNTKPNNCVRENSL